MTVTITRILLGLVFGVVALPAAAAERPNALGTAYGSTLWPKVSGVADVFYKIDSASDPNATANIQAAIKRFNSDFTGVIAWVPWTSAATQGPNYVDINLASTNTSGQCEALEGYLAVPAQRMWGSTTCTVGTILHEMGHVVGLWHEQSRRDRTSFVTVDYDNVIKGSWGNFEPPTDNFAVLAAYDYASVMQYPSTSLTRNGAPVIESIPAGIPLNNSDGVPGKWNIDYSAGDKEAIARLYGAAPRSVTVTSNPTGLNVIVDGATIATPKHFSWPLNSTHTLNVPSGVQTINGTIVKSTTKATFYYTYGRWSDSTARSHSIVVTPGNGDPTFPSTAPQVATYSANFVQLVPYAATVSPANSGTIAVYPAPKTYPGVAGTFFVARQKVKLTATPSASWAFYEFNNAPFWLPGGLGANPKTFYIPDSGNPVNTTAEFSNMPVYSVRLSPDYSTSNLYAYEDTHFAYTPKNFSAPYDPSWTPGTTHTLSIDASEAPYSLDSRYTFARWNPGVSVAPSIRTASFGRRANAARDSGLSETIVLPATSTSYSATITPHFAPATNFGYPPCGGAATLSPSSPTGDGFYPAGQHLSYAETPATGWTFAGWSYDLTGTSSTTTLTARDETLVLATFNITSTPLAIAQVSPASAYAGSVGFALTIDGTGFAPGSLVGFNGIYRQPTFVNSTELQIPITASDIAMPGAYQVFVENFPKGWTGCAVFAYEPFFVAKKP
jgi:hypothetical protein